MNLPSVGHAELTGDLLDFGHAIAVTDDRGHIERINASFAARFARLQPGTLLERVAPDDVEVVRSALLARALRNCEVALIDDDGLPVRASVSIAPAGGASRAVELRLLPPRAVFDRDDTVVDREAGPVEDAASCLSHDIGGHVRRVLGSVQLMGDSTRPDAEEDRARAESCARRAQLSVVRMARWLRLENGPLRCRPLQLHDAVDSATRIVRGQLEPFRLVGPEPFVLIGDAEQLEQLFVELLDNAVRHRAEGARDPVVEVVARAGPAPWLYVEVRDGNTMVPRIDRALRPGAAYGAGAGTGMGLAIAQRVASNHGGALWLEQGATGVRARVRLVRARELQVW